MTQFKERIHLIYFTDQGGVLAQKLQNGFNDQGYGADTTSGRDKDCKEWTKEHFSRGNVLIFVGASGIAVRAIAPCVDHKSKDPAVIVLDEMGHHAISLLSGHIGEANFFASLAASVVGGECVITTATDVNGLFSADTFAARNQLTITDFGKAKRFAADILKSRHGVLKLSPALNDVTEIRGTLPACMTIERSAEKDSAAAKRMTGDENSADRTETVENQSDECMGQEMPCALLTAENMETDCLRLVPKCLVIGMGCRRGKSKDELKRFLQETLASAHLDERAIAAVCSVDLKKDEEGLCELAREYGVPFRTYSAKALNKLQGVFTPSQFVYERTGTDNICERAAIAGGGEHFLVRKKAKDGMTIAVSICRIRLYFQKDPSENISKGICTDSKKGYDHTFFSNRSCKYFPCHAGVKEEDFNCLFCYCPLYTLGADCGGRFYYNSRGIKVCTDCTVPHNRKNYGYIVSCSKHIVDRLIDDEE